MPFTKIKCHKGEVELAWRDSGPRYALEHRLTSGDEPLPEFAAALQAFSRYVLHLCDLPPTYAAGLTVTGVSISENEQQGRGIVVTALKALADSPAPLVINTPHLPETPSHDDGPCLPTFTRQMLDELERRAADYRAGIRAQQDLFAGAAA